MDRIFHIARIERLPMDTQSRAGDITSAQLRREWSDRANGAGWAFPSDWHVGAIEAVCEAIADRTDVWAAAERLGQARAAAGVSLGEALADVDGLCAIAPPRYTSALRRAVSLGWADRVITPPGTVSDPLTGLVTAEYLRIRLGEIYRAAESRADPESAESAGSALVVIRLDLAGRTGWQRVLPMILCADSMRCVFDGGQTLAQLSETVAVVLAAREQMLARRARLLCSLVVTQVGRDPDADIPPPHVWIENLPEQQRAALEWVTELGR